MRDHNQSGKTHIFDEILEIIYIKKENGKSISRDALTKIQHFGQTFSQEAIQEAIEAGLIVQKNNHVDLTPAGLDQATRIIRCYRLAERLLTDILNVKDEIVESSACHFEHILSEEVAESICTLLGHPRTCPHGRPIPPGECCRRARTAVSSIIRPLSKLGCGESGTVAYISSPSHDRLTKLESLGLSPGQEVVVRQVQPAFIVSYGETELAVERSVADEIFLRAPADNHKNHRN
jgi:DtxR family Mn-dependent transcriptional regulator